MHKCSSVSLLGRRATFLRGQDDLFKEFFEINWFHAKIEIKRPAIRAFVEHADEASLVVNELIPRKETSFGLWCGPGVGGYFANLKVTILK